MFEVGKMRDNSWYDSSFGRLCSGFGGRGNVKYDGLENLVERFPCNTQSLVRNLVERNGWSVYDVQDLFEVCDASNLSPFAVLTYRGLNLRDPKNVLGLIKEFASVREHCDFEDFIYVSNKIGVVNAKVLLYLAKKHGGEDFVNLRSVYEILQKRSVDFEALSAYALAEGLVSAFIPTVEKEVKIIPCLSGEEQESYNHPLRIRNLEELFHLADGMGQRF